MSDKKVVKKVVQKPKEVKRLPTSSYSTRPKISRTYQTSSITFTPEDPQKKFLKTNSSFMKYHNQSSFVFEGNNIEEPVSKKEVQRRLKTQQFNSKLPSFNPKMANRSQIVFGDQKPNFTKKPVSDFTSPSRIPPGGRSQIVFG